jgi:electron transfer flavoprotein alpha subunit
MSGTLIIAEHRRGELRPVTFELIGAARAAGKQPIKVAVIADDPQKLAEGLKDSGVEEIVAVKVAARDFEPDIYEAVAQNLIEKLKPDLVLVPHSIDSFGYAAALAARAGYGFATDVFRFEYQDGELVATRGGYGQKVSVEVDFPGKDVVVLALRPNVFKAPEGSAAPQRFAIIGLAAENLRSRVVSREFVEMSSADDVDMTAAEFILAIGRGIGEQANVEQFRGLAETVGATLGCSRPIADAGWLPKSRQIGQSGKTASACRLYVALGISGAIQHLAGMKHVSTIVAVNADPNASIFSIARYGIVGDIFEISDALREHFQ